MDRFFAIDTAVVVSNIIDGEAIMLHRVSGNYFSTEGAGSLIWQWIGEGQGRGRILDMLTEGFTSERAGIETAVDSFLAELATHNLIREIAGGDYPAAEATVEPPAGPMSAPGVRFAPPTLHVYSDIRNLLLLDPLHNVSEMAGWPTPKPTDAAT
jgi:Coenzyme PQQ synthesis protein D (PqqD)